MADWFKRATQAAGKLSSQAAEKAAVIAETVIAQSRIHMDYEFAAEVGQCGPEGMWKIHRARPIKGMLVNSQWSNLHVGFIVSIHDMFSRCRACWLVPSLPVSVVHHSSRCAGAHKTVSVWILNKAMLQQYVPSSHEHDLHAHVNLWR